MGNQQEEEEVSNNISHDQISQCISVLESLNANTDQIFDIPKEMRLSLLMAAGMFSRPSKQEFARRKKEAKKAAKRKLIKKDKQARNGTGIRTARDASIFIAPTMIDLTGSEAKEEVELGAPRNCYVCHQKFNKLHHFYDTM